MFSITVVDPTRRVSCPSDFKFSMFPFIINVASLLLFAAMNERLEVAEGELKRVKGEKSQKLKL